MDIESINRNTFSLYKHYLSEEKLKDLLPIRGFRFTENLPRDVLKAQPELKTKYGIDAEQLKNHSGYTVLFSDNTAEIFIEKSGTMNNYLWCGTLIHEITHVRDYADYIDILHYDRFDEMLKCAHFWYWTEFHARYKGILYMLLLVSNLPEKYIEKYLNETYQRIKNFSDIIKQQSDYNMKIYYTVHMIGEILAYEQSSISVSDDFYKCITEEFDWFEEAKTFLSKHTESITVEEMLLISSNLTREFTHI